MTQGQVPGFFSPDGSRLAVNGWPSDDDVPFGSGWLLLDDQGGFVQIPRPAGPSAVVGEKGLRWARPIGWADGDHLYWRASSAGGSGRPVFVLVTTTLDGEVTDAVPVPAVRHPGGTSQWTASVSPGGQRVYLRSGGDDLVVDPDTGEVLETLSVDPPILCSPSWRGQQVLETDPGDGGAVALQALRERRDGGTARTPVAVLEPGLGSCLVLTPQALAGGPTSTLTSWLFGTSTSWLSWHLAEMTAGLSGLAVLGAALVWWRRRRFRYDEV
jgi:hypothetical protein